MLLHLSLCLQVQDAVVSHQPSHTGTCNPTATISYNLLLVYRDGPQINAILQMADMPLQTPRISTACCVFLIVTFSLLICFQFLTLLPYFLT